MFKDLKFKGLFVGCIFCLGVIPVGARADIANGLVGHWKLDESSGTTATDATGNHDGTLTSFQASPWLPSGGKVSGGLTLNNTNSIRVDAGDNYGFVGLAPFSAAAWVYRLTDTGASSFPIVMAKSGTDANGSQGWSFGMCNNCGTANRGFACSRYLDGANQVSIDLTGDIPYGQWVHAVCTYDGSRLRIYRDGILANTGAATSKSMIANTGTFKIGNTAGNTLGPRATYDDVRVYDRALTADEIFTLANPCTSVDAGNFKYHSANSTYAYCNGSNQIPFSSVASAGTCTTSGKLSYDTPSNEYQFCAGTNLRRAGCHPSNCDTIGDVCSDGSIYAGLSTDGSVRMYVTAADGGLQMWNSGAATGTETTAVSTTAGAANTATIITVDADGGTAGFQTHQAAQYCTDLTSHGQTDWYLPARTELDVLYTNRVAIGGFDLTKQYWSSTEGSPYNGARRRDFSDGTSSQNGKNGLKMVRCVRKYTSTCCLTMSSCTTAGELKWNSTSSILMFCNGSKYVGLGTKPGGSCP